MTASQAGENSQPNNHERTIESSILTDLNSGKQRKKNNTARNILKPEKTYISTDAFPNSNRHNNCINFNIDFDLGISKIKDRRSVQNPLNPLIKIFAIQLMKLMASHSNVEKTHAGTKPLTS